MLFYHQQSTCMYEWVNGRHIQSAVHTAPRVDLVNVDLTLLMHGISFLLRYIYMHNMHVSSALPIFRTYSVGFAL